MTLKDLTDLYLWIRKHNQHTPDEVVDFMYEAAKERLKSGKKSNMIDEIMKDATKI
jgi:uncharacterized protein YfkK (UPF0435 family)